MKRKYSENFIQSRVNHWIKRRKKLYDLITTYEVDYNNSLRLDVDCELLSFFGCAENMHKKGYTKYMKISHPDICEDIIFHIKKHEAMGNYIKSNKGCMEDIYSSMFVFSFLELFFKVNI